MADCSTDRARATYKQIVRELSEREIEWLQRRLAIHFAGTGRARVGEFNRPEISLTEHGKKKS